MEEAKGIFVLLSRHRNVIYLLIIVVPSLSRARLAYKIRLNTQVPQPREMRIDAYTTTYMARDPFLFHAFVLKEETSNNSQVKTLHGIV